MIKVTLSGSKALDAALKKLDVGLTKGVDAEMQATIADINTQQKSLAKVDFGLLRSSLDIVPNLPPLHKAVVSTGPGSSYAPYVEFGTGTGKDIPKGLEAEAKQYQKYNGNVRNGRAQPFFFAPAFREWKELVKRIEIMLKK